uniref:Uncharacterized protein n=1 Tax=Triticum urartu TaxID=4572 RepID=A0A8R7PB60_TRIUA
MTFPPHCLGSSQGGGVRRRLHSSQFSGPPRRALSSSSLMVNPSFSEGALFPRSAYQISLQSCTVVQSAHVEEILDAWIDPSFSEGALFPR